MSTNSPVYIEPCMDYSPDECRKAIHRLADAFPLLRELSPGSRVVIKPNLITFLSPEKAATTHPALLYALVEYLVAKGAHVIIGDSPGGPYTKAYLESVYSATGMKEAAIAGAELNYDFSVKTAHFPQACVAKEFEYTAFLDCADLIINFCKLKTHGMMGMSCAVKNMFGVIPGLTKPAYHYRFPDYSRFADMLIDLNEYFKPALNIVDAVIGMEGNGPTMGSPRRIGAVLASQDPYVLDLVCADLIGLTFEQIPTLNAAYKRGLSPQNASQVQVIGPLEAHTVRDFNTTSAERELSVFVNGWGPLGDLMNKAARNLLAVKPRLVKDACIGCKKCSEVCPASVITMRDRKPVIDHNACIRCFCCQELCPVGALEARRSRLGDMILKKKHV